MFLNGSEAWTLLSTDAAALRVFEGKALRRTFGPVQGCGDFRILSNKDLYKCSYANHTYYVILVYVELWRVEISNTIRVVKYECDEYFKL